MLSWTKRLAKDATASFAREKRLRSNLVNGHIVEAAGTSRRCQRTHRSASTMLRECHNILDDLLMVEDRDNIDPRWEGWRHPARFGCRVFFDFRNRCCFALLMVDDTGIQ